MKYGLYYFGVVKNNDFWEKVCVTFWFHYLLCRWSQSKSKEVFVPLEGTLSASASVTISFASDINSVYQVKFHQNLADSCYCSIPSKFHNVEETIQTLYRALLSGPPFNYKSKRKLTFLHFSQRFEIRFQIFYFWPAFYIMSHKF